MTNTTITRAILVVFIALSSFPVLYAQTGPGGVGSSSSNILWLKANEITGLTSGDDVLTWTDVSGNANTLTQPTASLSPVYVTNTINGLPVVRFNKANNRLRKGSFAGIMASNITAIYVNKTSDAGDATVSYASTASDNDLLLFRSQNLRVYRGSLNVTSGVSFNNNTFHIANAAWRSSDGRVEVWKNGTRSFTSTGLRTGSSISTLGTFALAGEQDSQDGGYQANQAHSGDFAEVIMFNTFLNTAQHIIVSNYLAAKYSLTIANNRYAYTSTHPHDVAGIGREDASNTHTAAMSANILRIQNASGLDANQEYLLFGHDNADATTAWTTTEAPNGSTNIQRLAREWRLDETGDVGTLDFVVNRAAMPALPAGHTMYALMVDADGDFSSGASVYEMALLAGSEYRVAGVDIADGDYVAIAAVRPSIDHIITSSSGSEVNNASIGLRINFIPFTAKTVQVTTANGTATAGSDYTALSSSLVTITAGNTTANYSVTIENDVNPESNESFDATLSNPSSGLNLGTNTVHTYTIIDNDIDRKVYFDAASSNGSETVTSVNIGLSISEADPDDPTKVGYEVTGGTAVGGGTDYTLASGTINFPATVTTANLTIPINNETLFENGETIIITLSSPVNANIDAGAGPIEHTYTINNDDTAPEIQFNATSSDGSETVTTINFQLDLSIVSGADASATFTVSGSASSGGVDYTLTSSPVSISAGSTTANVTATIVNDNFEELTETIIVTLTGATGATLGTNTVYTYSIINNSVIGFTGPGGVGQSSSNKLWLRSEDLAVVADATDITTWTDFSGNGNDLGQDDADFKPRYYNSITNSRPVVRFEQANGRLVKVGFSEFPSDEITAIYVNSTEDSGEGVLSYATTLNNNEFLILGSDNLTLFRESTNTASGIAFNDNQFNIVTTTWVSTGGGVTMWKNGTESYTRTNFESGNLIESDGALAIAGEQDSVDGGYQDDQNHTGDFTEVAIYNIKLNTAQIIIVQNYLAAKYGLTLGSNEVYNEDDTGNGNHDFEVAGIGIISSSDLHSDAKGSGIVRINDPKDLGNEEFLMWGHDNTSLKVIEITDVPVGVTARFKRVWRASEVNRSGTAVDVGDVDVSFDLSGLGNVTPADLVLLIDADGTFETGATEVAGAINDGGNVYRFNNVSGLSDNVYFTLGTRDSDQTPLPVELLSFTASVNKNDKVELKWSTASETNNSHFVIERTSDGNNYELLDIISGAGNSALQVNYKYTDQNALSGRSFYRLKQVDFSGEFEYSELVRATVVRRVKQNQFRIYPNPLSDNESIKIGYQVKQNQLLKIQIFSVMGKLILDYTESVNDETGTIELPQIRLPKGIVLIRITTAQGKVQSFKLINH